jgi:hypothetical protein
MQDSDIHLTCWGDMRPSLLQESADIVGAGDYRVTDFRPSANAITTGYASGPSSRHLGAEGAFKESGIFVDNFLASNHKAYLLEPSQIPTIGEGEYPPTDQGHLRLVSSPRGAAKCKRTTLKRTIFGIPAADEFADYVTFFCISLGWTCNHCGMPAVVRCSPVWWDSLPEQQACYRVACFAETVVCHDCWEAGEVAPESSPTGYLLSGLEYRSALWHEMGTLIKALRSFAVSSPKACIAPPTGLMAGVRKTHSIYLKHGLPLATPAPASPLPPFVLERDCPGDVCPYKMDTTSRVRTYTEEWRQSATQLNCAASAAQLGVFAMIAFDGYDRETCALDAGIRPVSLLYAKYKKLNTASQLKDAGWKMESDEDPTRHSKLNRTVASRMASDLIHLGSKTYLKSQHAASCHALTPVVALWRVHNSGHVAWTRQAYASGDTMACSLDRAVVGLAVLGLASCCGDQVDTGLCTPYWTTGPLKGPDCLCACCVRLVRFVGCYVLGTYGYGSSRIESLGPYGAWIKAYLACAPFDLDENWRRVAEKIVVAWEDLQKGSY